MDRIGQDRTSLGRRGKWKTAKQRRITARTKGKLFRVNKIVSTNVG